jgi:O-antigen/teichoic acid export membrane protein
MILLARIVGQTRFGEFGMIQATLGVAGMVAGFDLGATASRFIAQHGKTDPARAGRIIALLTLVGWALAFMAAIVLLLAAAWIARDLLHAGHLEPAIAAGTVLMVVTAIRGLQSGTLVGLERFDVVAKLNVLEGIAACVGLACLSWWFGIEGALLGMALGSFLAWVVGSVVARRILRKYDIRNSLRGCWREKSILLRFGLPSFLAGMIAPPVLWYCMMRVVQRVNGYEDLALYNAAYQWHGPLVFLPTILVSVSAPVLVQEWARGSLQQFRFIFILNAGFIFGASIVPIVLIASLSESIMRWYGSAFAAGWQLLILLAFAAPLHAMAKLASMALLGMNRAWSVLGANLIWGATMLALSSLLIPDWGAMGLAASFVAAYFLSMLAMTTPVLRSLRRAKSKEASAGRGSEL